MGDSDFVLPLGVSVIALVIALAGVVAPISENILNPLPYTLLVNRWHPSFLSPQVTPVALSPLATDLIYANPFFFSRKMTATKIGIYVSNVGSFDSSFIRLAVYDDNGCYPNELLEESGEIEIIFCDAQDCIYTFPSARDFEPGLYWLCIQVRYLDAVPLVPRYATNVGYVHLLGATTPLHDAQSATVSYRKSVTYGAYPDPFPSGATLQITQEATCLYITALL